MGTALYLEIHALSLLPTMKEHISENYLNVTLQIKNVIMLIISVQLNMTYDTCFCLFCEH
jgi:hypothetical protein